MDFQHGALSKAIKEGDLRNLIDSRITIDFFPDEKWRRVYEFLLSHWANYGVAPDEAIVRNSFPNEVWEVHEQPTQFFIDNLRLRRESVLQSATLAEVAQLLADEDEPEKVVKVRQLLQAHLVQAQLETSGTKDTDVISGYESILKRLGERRQKPGYLRGLSTGFNGIDFVTGGLQKEQFVVVTGVPKSGKSSFLLYMALAVWRQGKVPLFLGFEMSNTEQEDRLISLISGVSLTKILNGTTDRHEWGLINRAMRVIKDMQPFFLSADITSGMTASGIQSKIQKYQPAGVFVDGMYLMAPRDEKTHPIGTPGAVTDVSRSLKKLAQSSETPIVATTQSLVARSRGGLTLASIGYSSAPGQDADLILGVEPQSGSNISKFHVIESRSGPKKDTWIEWDWDRGYVGELDESQFTPQARQQGHGFSDDNDD